MNIENLLKACLTDQISRDQFDQEMTAHGWPLELAAELSLFEGLQLIVTYSLEQELDIAIRTHDHELRPGCALDEVEQVLRDGFSVVTESVVQAYLKRVADFKLQTDPRIALLPRAIRQQLYVL